MPDLVQWALVAGIGLAVAVTIAWPMVRAASTGPVGFDPRAEAEARALRHRIALDALMDVEADRRSGSLDDASYQRELAEAEARAAETLEASAPREVAPPALAPGESRGRIALLGAAVSVALLVGFAIPGPAGLAERTVVNQALADKLAQEAARQADVQRLLGLFAKNPRDAQVVSDLADAYLAGGSPEDLNRGAVALLVLLALEPENQSAYRRLITAYISAGDWADAQAATKSFAAVADPDEPDIPFYRGIIAFRQGDNPTAVREFDRFLALAPNDDRAPMVTSLRAKAVGELAGGSAAPSG